MKSAARARVVRTGRSGQSADRLSVWSARRAPGPDVMDINTRCADGSASTRCSTPGLRVVEVESQDPEDG
jgi:hypothetical protein